MPLRNDPLISLLIGLPFLGNTKKCCPDIIGCQRIQDGIRICTWSIIKGQIDIRLLRIIIESRLYFLQLLLLFLKLFLQIVKLLPEIFPICFILLQLLFQLVDLFSKRLYPFMIPIAINALSQDDQQTHTKQNPANHHCLFPPLTPSCTDAFLLSCHFVPLSPMETRPILQKYNISLLFRPVHELSSIDLIHPVIPVFWCRSKAPDYTADTARMDAAQKTVLPPSLTSAP